MRIMVLSKADGAPERNAITKIASFGSRGFFFCAFRADGKAYFI